MSRKKDPELMDAICGFIGQYYREKHISPSIREIAEGTGTSRATAQRYLVDMSESGRIVYKSLVERPEGASQSQEN